MTSRSLPAVHFLGIDVGTSACKTVLLDRRGRTLAASSQSYPTRRTPQGEVTQEPARWLRAVAATARNCVSAVGGGSIAGICVTAPAHVAVLVDREGTPLTRSLLAFDGRPEAVARALRKRFGPAFFDVTLVELTAGWTLPQLVWLRRQLGASEWQRIAQIALQKDYVRFSLTGERATDPSDAAGTAMFDQRGRIWADELVRAAGLRLDQLPPVRGAFELAGGLTRSWARRTGIRAGTPVAVGGTDTIAELLSIDAVQPDDALVKIASTGTIVVVSAEPRPRRGLLTYPHAFPDRWYSAAATSTAATAYNWCRAIVDADRLVSPSSYRGSRHGPEACPPVPRACSSSRISKASAFRTGTASSGAFVGLSSGHGREHLLRAVMEGVALSLRDCLEFVRGAGLAVSRPALTGGGVASPLWRRILAGALGVTVERVEPQGPAIGAALLAQGAVCGTAPRPWVRRTEVVPPGDWVVAYDRLYRLYAEAARALAPVSHELAAIAGLPSR